MTAEFANAFTLGIWLVEPQHNRITCGDRSIRLRPQVMELLICLAERNGQVISASELLDRLWNGRVVSENSVYNCIAELRQALSDETGGRSYIRTVAKKGYCLTVPAIPTRLPNDPYRRSTPARQLRILGIAAAAIAVVGAVAMYAARDPGDRLPAAAPEAAAVRPVLYPLDMPEYADASMTNFYPGMTISPDGRDIAYVGRHAETVFLYLKRADEFRPRRLSGTDNAAVPVFSPDGNSIAFFADGYLKRVATTGGNPAIVTAVSSVPIGATWGDDDFIVVPEGYRTGLLRVKASGGVPQSLTELRDGVASHRYPFALPDGRGLLYQVGVRQDSIIHDRPAEIWVYDASTREHRFLIEGTTPKYAGGRLLFGKNAGTKSAIWVVEFDIGSLSLRGEPKPLVSENVAGYEVSSSGALVYAERPVHARNTLLLLEPDHDARQIFEADRLSHPRFSGNGRYIALSVGEVPDANIWIIDLGHNGKARQLTTTGGIYPAWLNDDSGLLYWKRNEGIYHQPLDGGLAEIRLPGIGNQSFPLEFNPHGLLYVGINPETNGDLYLRPSEGADRVLESDSTIMISAAVSPDGRWIAENHEIAQQVYVVIREFPDGKKTWRVPIRSGMNPKWSADGSRLYVSTTDGIWSIPVDTGLPVQFGQKRLEARINGLASIIYDPYDLSPNQRTLAVIDIEHGSPPAFVYMTNWL